jgi:hypothetical protein
MPNLDRSFIGKLTEDNVRGFMQRVTKALNSQISFGKTNNMDGATVGGNKVADASNISCYKTSGITPAANTTFSVSHNLPWVPWFYFYNVNVGVAAGIEVVISGLPGTYGTWTAATSGTNGTILLQCTVTTISYTMIII